MAAENIQQRHAAAQALLRGVGQEHVLRYFGEVGAAEQETLLGQIESVDWRELAGLIETHVKAKPKFEMPGKLDPAPWYPREPKRGTKQKYQKARRLGEQLLRENKVAAFTVAGGQGTRLGWDAPKGTFPATPIRKLPLFACFAEYIRKAQQKYECVIPWYIMTSPVNDAPTRAFFESNGYFGLDPDNVLMFPQAMMPAVDMRPGANFGKVLLESKSTLALSPNGHGGSLKALYSSGAIGQMKARGVEHISYTQVDNPIVRVVDPQFLGLHALDECQMSSKMLPKAYPKEKLGNFCVVDGKITVIEYSDLPDALAEERLADGQLRFLAGSIAIHAIRVDFVDQLNSTPEGFGLPWHRAEKKVAYFDLEANQAVQPDKVNAVKLETFVFDALPFCQKSIIYETDRLDEFAPIKNADGPATGPGVVPDSPTTSKQIQILRAARWLEEHGVKVPYKAKDQPDAVIEISQLTAIESVDLKKVDLPESITAGTEVLL